MIALMPRLGHKEKRVKESLWATTAGLVQAVSLWMAYKSAMDVLLLLEVSSLRIFQPFPLLPAFLRK